MSIREILYIISQVLTLHDLVFNSFPNASYNGKNERKVKSVDLVI